MVWCVISHHWLPLISYNWSLAFNDINVTSLTTYCNDLHSYHPMLSLSNTALSWEPHTEGQDVSQIPGN